MDEESKTQKDDKVVKKFVLPSNLNRLLVGSLVFSVVLGTITGYFLSKKPSAVTGNVSPLSKIGAPKTAQQDTKTFRDFAEGTMKAKPQPVNPSEYTEGTHYLEREGGVPVALTSSVVDLSTYEGKKVKVFGETQKALKEGWLMDVGRVEEIK